MMQMSMTANGQHEFEIMINYDQSININGRVFKIPPEFGLIVRQKYFKSDKFWTTFE